MDAPSPTQSLRSRVLSGTLWMGLLRILARVIGVGTTIIVARLVPLPELGTYAMLLILDAGLQAFTAVGFDAALVQMRKDPSPYLDTAWATAIIRAVIVYIVEFVAAPAYCAWMGVPDATWAMRTLALAPLVMGFHSTSTQLLMRDMRFNRLFFTYASEIFTFSAVTLTLCAIRPDRWAPIIGYVCGFTARVIVSHLVLWRPIRFKFELAKAQEMFPYSKWLILYSAADFALETADNLVVGKVLGKDALARYRNGAYQLAMEGPVFLQFVVTRVAFPTFANIQVQPDRIRDNFRAVLGMVSVTMVPAAVALFALAEPIIVLLLGAPFAPAAPALQVLALAALLRSIIEIAPPVLRALGHTRADFLLRLFQVAVMASLLYAGATLYGIRGVAWAVLLGAIGTLPLWSWTLAKSAGLGAGDFVVPVTAPLLAGLAALGVWALLPPASNAWPSLLSHGAALGVTYVLASAILYRLLPSSGVRAVLHGLGR